MVKKASLKAKSLKVEITEVSLQIDVLVSDLEQLGYVPTMHGTRSGSKRSKLRSTGPRDAKQVPSTAAQPSARKSDSYGAKVGRDGYSRGDSPQKSAASSRSSAGRPARAQAATCRRQQKASISADEWDKSGRYQPPRKANSSPHMISPKQFGSGAAPAVGAPRKVGSDPSVRVTATRHLQSGASAARKGALPGRARGYRSEQVPQHTSSLASNHRCVVLYS